MAGKGMCHLFDLDRAADTWAIERGANMVHKQNQQ